MTGKITLLLQIIDCSFINQRLDQVTTSSSESSFESWDTISAFFSVKRFFKVTLSWRGWNVVIFFFSFSLDVGDCVLGNWLVDLIDFTLVVCVKGSVVVVLTLVLFEGFRVDMDLGVVGFETKEGTESCVISWYSIPPGQSSLKNAKFLYNHHMLGLNNRFRTVEMFFYLY